MKSAMQQVPLTVGLLLDHAVATHPAAHVVTSTGTGSRSVTFGQIGNRSAQPAHAFRGLGINAEHVEAYLAVPAMGAVLHTVNIRLSEAQLVSDDGQVQPRDGTSVDELEVRGPYVSAGYPRVDKPDVLHNGWLRTGDVGTIDEFGFAGLSDRAMDIIKSGGECISSIELESAVVSHPAVREVAVIGIPDDCWQERPLAIVALHPGSDTSITELQEHLSGLVARCQIPEAWVFVEPLPKTSVAKFDKKWMRTMHRDRERAVGRSSETTAHV